MFRQAERRQSKLRMTIDGPAGSGKSYTALRFATALQQAFGGKIAAIDTERGSLSKYVGEAPDGLPWDFDVVELQNFSPEKYTELIQYASKHYSVLIIDSLSHAWEGVGGALEIKDRAGGADWKAWRTVTPIHTRMVDSILQSSCHVITSMRSRMEYVQEVDTSTGRTIVRKVGMSPIQRPGMEYEFDLVCDIDWAHIMTVSKSRCSAVQDLKVEKPGPNFMAPVIDWLQSGNSAPVMKAFQPVITLDDLVSKYGIEKVLEVNSNLIPERQDEIDQIALLLSFQK